MTFLKALTTHMKTAFSLGSRLMVFSGRRTRRTLRDLTMPRSRFMPMLFLAWRAKPRRAPQTTMKSNKREGSDNSFLP